MMSFAFILGLVALLITPGPTNTLLALGGASQGAFRPAMPLLVAEVLAYVVVIITTGLVAGALLGSAEDWRTGLQLLAAGYLVHTSVKLWRQGALPAQRRVVTPRMVALTTLSNPKGIIIALALMPPGWAGDLGLAAASLLAVVLVVPLMGGAWVMAGVLLARGDGLKARILLPRLSSLALGGFALLLARAALVG